MWVCCNVELKEPREECKAHWVREQGLAWQKSLLCLHPARPTVLLLLVEEVSDLGLALGLFLSLPSLPMCNKSIVAA